MSKQALHQEKQAGQAPTFTKEQFVRSAQFSTSQKDVLNALLAEETVYTVDQVAVLVEQFMKKEAK